MFTNPQLMVVGISKSNLIYCIDILPPLSNEGQDEKK